MILKVRLKFVKTVRVFPVSIFITGLLLAFSLTTSSQNDTSVFVPESKPVIKLYSDFDLDGASSNLIQKG